MGSAMRKMGVYLGLLEDTERYDDEYYDEYDEPQQPRARVEEPAVQPPRRRREHLRAPSSRTPAAPPRAGAARTAGRGRRAVPDHHAAPAHLQRGTHHR